MSRPPTNPAEKKLRIVLSVLQSEISIADVYAGTANSTIPNFHVEEILATT